MFQTSNRLPSTLLSGYQRNGSPFGQRVASASRRERALVQKTYAVGWVSPDNKLREVLSDPT